MFGFPPDFLRIPDISSCPISTDRRRQDESKRDLKISGIHSPFLTISDVPRCDKSLARPTPLCVLFDGENISFDASLVLYK
jgi:hypothetical protein